MISLKFSKIVLISKLILPLKKDNFYSHLKPLKSRILINPMRAALFIPLKKPVLSSLKRNILIINLFHPKSLLIEISLL